MCVCMCSQRKDQEKVGGVSVCVCMCSQRKDQEEVGGVCVCVLMGMMRMWVVCVFSEE